MITKTLTANGSTPWVEFQGQGSISCIGTFNSGTVTLEISDDSGTTPITLKNPDGSGADYEITANDTINISRGNCLLRATVVGASPAPSLTLVFKMLKPENTILVPN